MLFRFLFSLGLVLASGRAARAWNSPAPDVVLYCLPALDAALQRAAAGFRAQTGVEVHIFAAPPDGLLGLIKHRARDDVVVADAPTIATLAGSHAVRAESVVGLGQDPFVLIGKAGGGVQAGAAAKQLLAAYPTVLPDPTTAASFDGPAVLRQDPQANAAAHTIGVSDTPEVVARVRNDASVIGLVYQTEAAANGIVKAATLQAPAAQISGALVTNGQSANAARLLAYIAGPDGGRILRQAGLEATP